MKYYTFIKDFNKITSYGLFAGQGAGIYYKKGDVIQGDVIQSGQFNSSGIKIHVDSSLDIVPTDYLRDSSTDEIFKYIQNHSADGFIEGEKNMLNNSIENSKPPSKGFIQDVINWGIGVPIQTYIIVIVVIVVLVLIFKKKKK